MSGATLGNFADRMMQTSVPTTVTTQAGRYHAGNQMPAPRATARVGDDDFLPGLGEEEVAYKTRPNDMLPGMGLHDDMLPGMGNHHEMLPGMGAIDWKSPMTLGLIGAAVLFLTPIGKPVRKAIGMKR